MERKLFYSIILMLVFSLRISGQNQISSPTATDPIIVYHDSLKNIVVNGKCRTLELRGKSGLNTTSIHSSLELPQHNLNSDSGALTVWFFSLEDLSPFVSFGKMQMHNQHIKIYPLLSDYKNPQDFDSASFKLVYDAGWHPNLMALFAQGKLYEDAFNPPHRALVSANHFQFQKNQWYQVALSWNHPENYLRLYVNGVLVGAGDQFYEHLFHRDRCGPSLFTGNPTLCYSTIAFYDKLLSDVEVKNIFSSEVTDYNQELQEKMLHTYAGEDRKPFAFTPDRAWSKVLDYTLTEKQELDSFYIQGNPVKVEITDEGLLVETINKEYHSSLLDSQVYLWTNRPFEGDLYIEYEFMSLRHGGLSLLMAQASGMNREDFMADYPLRTSGRMSMVCWEDVRNYHWEYYREMADVRNDVSSSAMMKNPFMTPIGYGCLNKPLAHLQWHKLQFLQRGNHIIGAIDGVIMINAVDDGMSNNGPVLNFGRAAIRCMLRTKMLFRNLKIYNRHQEFSVLMDE